jgi:MYXO-CTERM domain-containing protein
MITTWLVGGVALAGIDIGGTTYPTLWDAGSAAVDGDTLVFDGGTYEGAMTIVGLHLTLVGNGSTITEPGGTYYGLLEVLSGASLVASDLTLESTLARGVDVDAGSTIDLTRVTFRTVAPDGNGGGIRAVGPASITLRDVTFDQTSALGAAFGKGGGLYLDGATGPVVLTDVRFEGTSARRQGGGIWVNDAAVECVGCVFTGGDGGIEGGAIYATGSGPLAVLDSTFTLTSAGSGGAIQSAVPLTVTGSTFCGTSAAANGGAIDATGYGGTTLSNNVFLDSTAFEGGVARIVTDNLTLEFNTALGSIAPEVFALNPGAALFARNNLFAYNSGIALVHTGGPTTHWYNAYFANDDNVSPGGTGPTDVLADPRLAGFLDDGICGNDQLWPVYGSPLVDAGESNSDPDGSRSDLGAYGGPGADPTLHLEDGDGDGASVLRDCDDADPARSPGLVDECDGLDNDCSGGVDDDAAEYPPWYEDCDGDGSPWTDEPVYACEAPVTGCNWLASPRGLDCDDTNPLVYPFGEEYCLDGVDGDCDGNASPDEYGAEDGTLYFWDDDGDGFGGSSVRACAQEPGMVTVGGDCQDWESAVFPGAADTCGDEVDTDCSGYDGTPAQHQMYYVDADGDGSGGEVDNILQGVLSCAPVSGHALTHDDCDDTTAAIGPQVVETCNGADEDCDGVVDDAPGGRLYYVDGDGDGYGSRDALEVAPCGPPPGFVDNLDDCDDARDGVFPGAVERCNDRDDDCDGRVDAADQDLTDGVEGWLDGDGDGFGACPDSACSATIACGYGAQPEGPDVVRRSGDCADDAADVFPGAPEIVDDAVDQDCDGVAAVSPPEEPTVKSTEAGCGCSSAPTPPGLLALTGLVAACARRRRGTPCLAAAGNVRLARGER